jgi:hypothetical protein
MLNCFAQTCVKAEVDKTTLTQDETITYKLIITSSEDKLPQPEIAAFNGFDVISQAQSSTISFVKGTARTNLVYAFILAPTKAGKFKIGPSSIRIKNKTYSTDSFEVEVKGEIIPERKPKQPIPGENQTESEEVPQYTL